MSSTKEKKDDFIDYGSILYLGFFVVVVGQKKQPKQDGGGW